LLFYTPCTLTYGERAREGEERACVRSYENK